MDDPIFDPWSTGDESAPAPAPRSSRWRSVGGSSEGVPATRPVPTPLTARTDPAAAPERFTDADEPTDVSAAAIDSPSTPPADPGDPEADLATGTEASDAVQSPPQVESNERAYEPLWIDSLEPEAPPRSRPRPIEPDETAEPDESGAELPLEPDEEFVAEPLGRAVRLEEPEPFVDARLETLSRSTPDPERPGSSTSAADDDIWVLDDDLVEAGEEPTRPREPRRHRATLLPADFESALPQGGELRTAPPSSETRAAEESEKPSAPSPGRAGRTPDASAGNRSAPTSEPTQRREPPEASGGETDAIDTDREAPIGGSRSRGTDDATSTTDHTWHEAALEPGRARADVGPVELPGSRRDAPWATTRRRSALEAGADALRDVLVPTIEAVRQRLLIARHGTTIDDRLDRREPSFRFRIEPWTAPFDEVTAPPAVLEVAVVENGASVDGRIWLDPLSTHPCEHREIARSDFSRAWVEGLLVDFVQRALAPEEHGRPQAGD